MTNFDALKKIFQQLESDLLSLDPSFNQKEYPGGLDKNPDIDSHSKNFLDSAWYVISQIKTLIDAEFSKGSLSNLLMGLGAFKSYAKYLSRYKFNADESTTFKAFYITDERTEKASKLIFQAINDSLPHIDSNRRLDLAWPLDVHFHVPTLLKSASDALDKRLALYQLFNEILDKKYEALVEYIEDNEAALKRAETSVRAVFDDLNKQINLVEIKNPMTQDEVDSSIDSLNALLATTNTKNTHFLVLMELHQKKLIQIQDVGPFIEVVRENLGNRDEAIKSECCCKDPYFSSPPTFH